MYEFFDEFVFLDHTASVVDVKVSILRKYIINRFRNTIPPSRKLTTLSLIEDIILKLHDKNLEGIQDDMYAARDDVLYMLSFENFVDENPIGDDNDDDNDGDKSE